MSLAKTESYQAGYQEGQQATPTVSTPSVGEEEIGRRVKAIMNQAYQTMAAKLKAKEEFERSEVLSMLLSTIKVSEAMRGPVVET